MKSDKYWAKRAEKRMDYAMLSSNEVSDRIGAAYLDALRDIQEQLQAIFRSFSADITDAEAKRILQRVPIDRDADITKLLKQAIALVKDDKERAELIAELNAPAYKARMQRLKELSQDIGDKCAALAQEADSCLDRGLEQVIRDTYYRGVFDMQQRTGIAFSFSKVSERMIREILQQAWSGRHYSKRIWQNTDTLAAELRQTLLKGVLTGKSSGRMAAEIQDRFHASYSRALTLVRTEHSYCANSAELARYKDIDVKKYRYVATLDSHTSEICRDLDGQEFPVEDAAPGTNYPPMHPRCRSTTIEALSPALMQKLERRARDPETGKLMTVPADMTYREWYGKYVEGVSTLYLKGGSDIKFDRLDGEKPISKRFAEEYRTEYDKFTKIFGDLPNLSAVNIAPYHNDGVYGGYNPNSSEITLLGVGGKNGKAFMQAVAADEKKRGEWSTSSPYHTFRHELGHALQQRMRALDSDWDSKLREITEIKQTLEEQLTGMSESDIIIFKKNKLSRYGFESIDEFVSESLAEYANSPRKARATAKSVAKILLRK